MISRFSSLALPFPQKEEYDRDYRKRQEDEWLQIVHLLRPALSA
jgi:hypothetical protein